MVNSGQSLDEAGTITSYVVVKRDVTERKRLRAKCLRRADMVEEVAGRNDRGQ